MLIFFKEKIPEFCYLLLKIMQSKRILLSIIYDKTLKNWNSVPKNKILIILQPKIKLHEYI